MFQETSAGGLPQGWQPALVGKEKISLVLFRLILCSVGVRIKLCKEPICSAYSFLLVLEVGTGRETLSYCFTVSPLLASQSWERKVPVGDKHILCMGSSSGQGFWSRKVVLEELKQWMTHWAVLETYLRMEDRQWSKTGTEASVAESGGNRLEKTGRKRTADNMWFKRGTLRLAKQTAWDGCWKEEK